MLPAPILCERMPPPRAWCGCTRQVWQGLLETSLWASPMSTGPPSGLCMPLITSNPCTRVLTK